jgi:hypothetical protein
MSRHLALGLCLAALAGCATGGGREPDGPPEFVGRALSVTAANGQETILRFRPDGVVAAHFGSQVTQGQWTLARGELCFTWRQTFRECWPRGERFREDRALTVRSDRGNVVRVLLRD